MDRHQYLARRFARDPALVTRDIAGEQILVPVRQPPGEEATIYALNDVSAFIWAHIDGHTSVSEIRDAVVAEFDVGREQAEADLVDFLQQLEQIGALTQA
jgi:hypothetical protein